MKFVLKDDLIPEDDGVGRDASARGDESGGEDEATESICPL